MTTRRRTPVEIATDNLARAEIRRAEAITELKALRYCRDHPLAVNKPTQAQLDRALQIAGAACEFRLLAQQVLDSLKAAEAARAEAAK